MQSRRRAGRAADCAPSLPVSLTQCSPHGRPPPPPPCTTRHAGPRKVGGGGGPPLPSLGSQKVVWRWLLRGDAALVLRRRLEDFEVLVEVLVQLEDGGDVAAAVAVVWRRPDGHQRVVEHVLVPLHHQLVRARDQVDRVGRAELGDHVAAKEVARASRRQAPPVDVLRVGPHQVAHRAVVRDLLLPVDDADLVEGVDGGGEAAVHAEDLVLDQRRERQVVEDLCAVPPDVDRAVLAQALVIKAVHLRDLPRLVVAPQQRDPVRPASLEQQQQRHRLDRVVAAVDEVAHEDIARLRARASAVEQLKEVVELAVDVAADGDGRLHRLHRRLFQHQLLHILAQVLEV
mmetsp:Transcript_33163/g.105757  ORF Transcript_33163/g.105757 Transcript_33163/m.105757 type:complete len:344 (+) Transcript_33163:85-1116(+)